MNQKNQAGDTPLHFAVKAYAGLQGTQQKESFVALLETNFLKASAVDLTCKNAAGQTPEQLAKKLQCEQSLIDLLKQYEVQSVSLGTADEESFIAVASDNKDEDQKSTNSVASESYNQSLLEGDSDDRSDSDDDSGHSDYCNNYYPNQPENNIFLQQSQ